MADTGTAEIRALLGGGSGEDRVAATHFMVGAVFLVIGSALSLLAFASLRFADLFPVTFGRLEPMANLTLMLGFGAVSLIGGVYYVLPRLTGARLWSKDLARLGLIALSGLVVLGVIALAFGFGTGRQPFGLPWWLHLPTLFVLAIPVMITVGTISHREEERSYVTLWFVLAGTAWMPLLYLVNFAGELPFLTSLQVAYADLFFSSGFVTMVILTLGTGLFYYAVVKELDIPLASRQLALVGLWSLGFASVWWGAAQLLFGPGPTWVSGASAALGLAFPVGALANAANVSLTLEGSWGDLGEKPGVASGIVGLYLAVGLAALAAVAGFRSVASVTALTSFWEGVEYLAIAGVGTLLIAGVTFSALPRLVGREIQSLPRARSFMRFTVAGSVGVLLTLAAAGVMSGYSWLAGSNSAAYIDAGEGWAAGVGGTVDTLTLAAVVFSAVALAGHFAYASVIFGTITSGTARTQEILVSRDVADE